jgi:hypothetical protein
MYVCMYACMYVCIYVCTYVCMHACIEEKVVEVHSKRWLVIVCPSGQDNDKTRVEPGCHLLHAQARLQIKSHNYRRIIKQRDRFPAFKSSIQSKSLLALDVLNVKVATVAWNTSCDESAGLPYNPIQTNKQKRINRTFAHKLTLDLEFIEASLVIPTVSGASLRHGTHMRHNTLCEWRHQLALDLVPALQHGHHTPFGERIANAHQLPR